MGDLKVGTIIQFAVLIGAGVYQAWRGYHRRKAHWSRGSWIAFGLTLLSGVALFGFSLAFAVAVDRHATWVGGPRSPLREYWILTSIGSMVAGGCLLVLPLAWFADGKPDRPFFLAGWFERGRRKAQAATAGEVSGGERERIGAGSVASAVDAELLARTNPAGGRVRDRAD